MTKKRIRQIMAYIYMPLFFTIIGYGIIYLAASPFIKTIGAIGSIITSDNVPDFSTDFNILYDDDTARKASSDNSVVELSDITMPYYGTQYGVISCSRIDFNAPLFFGDNSSILRNGVGQYIGSGIPGFNMPILLCGHNTTFCLPLQYIEKGDIVTIKTNYGTYEYEITDTQVHNMNDRSAYDLGKNEEQLIIYTCYPFDMLGNKTNRLFVYGNKISGPVINGLNQ